MLLGVDREAGVAVQAAAALPPGAGQNAHRFCEGLSSTVRVDFDHRFEEGDTGLSRRSAQPMKRRRKVSELRCGSGCSGPDVTEFASARRRRPAPSGF